jgi:hypothetical protein
MNESPASAKTAPTDWISLLNEQADEWHSIDDVKIWLSAVVQRPASPDDASLQEFWDTLNLMRALVYDLHFNRVPDFKPINTKLAGVEFCFYTDAPGVLPRFRARSADQGNDSALLLAMAATVLANFAHALARHMSGDNQFDIARCEGLYRDPHVKRLSAAPNVADDEELKWRREVEVLVEKGLECSPDILRCADLFVSTSRSRFCSNACRTNTFQVIKQLKDPVYLAAKQRRYRDKKR